MAAADSPPGWCRSAMSARRATATPTTAAASGSTAGRRKPSRAWGTEAASTTAGLSHGGVPVDLGRGPVGPRRLMANSAGAPPDHDRRPRRRGGAARGRRAPLHLPPALLPPPPGGGAGGGGG